MCSNDGIKKIHNSVYIKISILTDRKQQLEISDCKIYPHLIKLYRSGCFSKKKGRTI